MSYYLDPYDNNSYYPSNSLLSASQEDLLLNGSQYSQGSTPLPPPNRSAPHPPSHLSPYPSPAPRPLSNPPQQHSSSIPLYPSYDVNSPFNSPIVPVKNVGKDGRLKTMLMGIGIDGGFLTSPLSFGRSSKNTPSSSDLRYSQQQPRRTSHHLAQPLPQQSHSSHSAARLEEEAYQNTYQAAMTRMNSNQSAQMGSSSSSSGMGRMSGSNNGYDDTSLPYASSSSLQGQSGGMGPGGMLPGAQRQRTVSAAPSTTTRPTTIDTSSHIRPRTPQPHPDSIPVTLVEAAYPSVVVQPPSSKSVLSKVAASMKKPRKVTSSWSLKTLSKAKSCPTLNATVDPSATTSSYRLLEPLTPVSNPVTYFPATGVPFNSPVDEQSSMADPTTTMPFSFADLYNYGLAVDSVADIDPRKSPYDFASDLIGSENEQAGDTLDIGTGTNYLDDLSEYGLVYGLPTPHLAPSGVSSPSTGFNSETSPLDLHLSPGIVSNPVILDSSIRLPVVTQSRQRCLSYGGPRSHAARDDSSLDPSVYSTTMIPSLSESSSHTNYTTSTYSYPTNYVSTMDPIASTSQLSPQVHVQLQSPQHHHQSQSQHHQYPVMSPSYARSPVPPPPPHHSTNVQQYLPTFEPQASGTYVAQGGSYPSQSGSFASEGGLFETRGGSFGPQPTAPSYEAQLRGAVSLDSMYHTYAEHQRGSGSKVLSTPKKRGRDTTDEEDGGNGTGTDGDEYIPGSRPAIPTPKRQRVVSAPASVGKRLKPGPRPKSQSRSPQEGHTAVFSLSPPPMPYYRDHSTTPYLSDASPYYDGAGSLIMRDEVIALPKEVIQSLYNTISPLVKEGLKMARRYECLIEGCGREFPRKSAIESHIQTHLEDKPFVCTQEDWCVIPFLLLLLLSVDRAEVDLALTLLQ